MQVETQRKSPLIYQYAIKKAKRNFLWATYFMAYPFWTIIQNLSFFYMMFFYQRSFSLPHKMLEVRGVMSFGSILFMLGAISSTIGAGINLGYEYFGFAIKVLPNYIYWGFLVLTLGNLALKTVTLNQIYKMIFWGLVSSCLSFFLLKPILEGVPFFRNVTQNNFAFILISFGPMGIYYVQQKWKNSFYTIIAIAAISFCGIISGSRSGSLLVFLGCALAISIESWLKILILAFLGVVLYLITPQLLESPFIKSGIHDLNERTYDLLYETDATLTTDRSYLTRLAMIEKGLNIFEQYPIAGIGIGNFSNKTFEVDFDFEGAEYIEGKEDQLESKTNPHNSYVSFLSEGGLLLFIPAILLMFFPILYFIGNYIKLSGEEKALFIGVIFMCIHAWFIAGMINVYGWFILGITNAVIKSKK